MNAYDERVSDSENFSVRITKIGVTVPKIWRKEIIGTYLEFLESGRGYFLKYFKNQGSSWEF
jgi:hypothetical protein